VQDLDEERQVLRHRHRRRTEALADVVRDLDQPGAKLFARSIEQLQKWARERRRPQPLRHALLTQVQRLAEALFGEFGANQARQRSLRPGGLLAATRRGAGFGEQNRVRHERAPPGVERTEGGGESPLLEDKARDSEKPRGGRPHKMRARSAWLSVIA
jgi:hypothetical protein